MKTTTIEAEPHISFVRYHVMHEEYEYHYGVRHAPWIPHRSAFHHGAPEHMKRFVEQEVEKHAPIRLNHAQGSMFTKPRILYVTSRHIHLDAPPVVIVQVTWFNQSQKRTHGKQYAWYPVSMADAAWLDEHIQHTRSMERALADAGVNLIHETTMPHLPDERLIPPHI